MPVPVLYAQKGVLAQYWGIGCGHDFLRMTYYHAAPTCVWKVIVHVPLDITPQDQLLRSTHGLSLGSIPINQQLLHTCLQLLKIIVRYCHFSQNCHHVSFFHLRVLTFAFDYHVAADLRTVHRGCITTTKECHHVITRAAQQCHQSQHQDQHRNSLY